MNIDFDRPPALPEPTEKGHHVISLGAGVQSSALALMAGKGIWSPMPEAAIFADTKAEPSIVYDWLDWLEGQLPFPVYRITAGSLTEHGAKLKVSKNGKKYIHTTLPLYSRNGSRKFRRQCTYLFKIKPMHQEIRKMYGTDTVIQWFGISWDELQRMRDSERKYIIHRYPFIERRITREMCKEWLTENGYPAPPRSACIYCPFRNNEDWESLRDESPGDFKDAGEYEKTLQRAYRDTGLEYDVYLHRDCVPLENVDFTENQTMDLFGNDCKGYCGV